MDKENKPYRKDELTLGEVFEYGGAYVGALKKNILAIIGGALIFGVLSFFYFSSKPTLYKARLSFMLNEDESNQLSSMNTILGQLGFPIVNQRINISKVLELSLSRKIVQDAIFQKIETPHGKDFLANHIIDIYELRDSWTTEEEDMGKFKFAHNKIDSFTYAENRALRSLATIIAGTPSNRKSALIETDYGQNTTIMSYVTHSEDEALSYHLTNAIFKATTNFYIDKSVEKQRSTLNVLTAKKDSFLTIYNRLEYAYAQLSDRSSNLFSKKMEIKRERTRGEMLQMSSGLAKLEENIALVEFGIENSTPILQVIDPPILPLEEIKTSKIKSVIVGLFFGFIMSIGLIIIHTFWRLLKIN